MDLPFWLQITGFIALLGGGMAALGFAWQRSYRRRLGVVLERLRHVAESLDLEVLPLNTASDPDGLSIFGRVGQAHVAIEFGPDHALGLRASRITIQARSLPSSEFLLFERSGFDAAVGGSGPRTGDPDFDEQVRTTGPRARVLAVLGEQARANVLRALDLPRSWIREGEASCSLPSREASTDAIVHAVRALADAVTSVNPRVDDLAPRLAHHVSADPIAGVRHHSLQVLLEEYGDSEVTRGALEAACNDQDERVRSLALGVTTGTAPGTLALLEPGEEAGALSVAQDDGSLALTEEQAPGAKARS